MGNEGRATLQYDIVFVNSHTENFRRFLKGMSFLLQDNQRQRCNFLNKDRFNKPSQGGVGGSSRFSFTGLAACFRTSSVTSCSKASPSRRLQLIERASWNSCLPKESFVMMVKNSEIFFWCSTAKSCMEHWNISLSASTGDTSRNFITQLLRSPRSCPKRSFLILCMFLMISSSMSTKICSRIAFHRSLSHFFAFLITYKQRKQHHHDNLSINLIL